MAFGRLSDEGDDQPMADINMIPMIDVMLVLLIVFMITAPLLTDAVKLFRRPVVSSTSRNRPTSRSRSPPMGLCTGMASRRAMPNSRG